MEPFVIAVDTVDGHPWKLPSAIEDIYGRFSLPDSVVFANFVSSLDGVVSLERGGSSSALIRGTSDGDRFMMALLRSAADAIVVGRVTFSEQPATASWTGESMYPPFAQAFSALRNHHTTSVRPQLVVVTASGQLPLLDSTANIVVATTDDAAPSLRQTLPAHASVLPIGTGDMDTRVLVDALRDRGFRRILLEGGPRLFASFLRDGVLDELFLTVSPVICGRDDDLRRPGFADGWAMSANDLQHAQLMSLRTQESHLFLRYRLNNNTRRSPQQLAARRP